MNTNAPRSVTDYIATDHIRTETDLVELVAFYERQNAEQAAILNRVVAENTNLKQKIKQSGRTQLREQLAACQQERDELIAIRKSFAERNAELWARDQKCAEQLAAITQERDELDHEFRTDHRLYLQCKHDLAASQAREQQLLAELRYYKQRYDGVDNYTLPQDDTALRQWGAKLLRTIVGSYCWDSKNATSYRDELLRKANELRSKEYNPNEAK